MRVLFWATALFAAATFWFVPRPPMTDLPQHASQVALLRALLDGHSKWQALLYIDWFTPYLAGGPALLLSYVMPALAALKLLLSLSYLGFVWASVALRRELGGDERLDWLFVPSFFGMAWAMGLYPFLVAAPIAVLFILVALRHARSPSVPTGVLLLLIDIALFFAHGLAFLFANVIGGLFLLLRTRGLSRFALAALPYAGAGVIVVAYSVTQMHGAEGSGSALSSASWDLYSLRASLTHLWAGSSPLVARSTLFAILFVAQVAAPLFLRARVGRGEALVPFVIVMMVWLAVPESIQGTGLLYMRFSMFVLPFYALLFVPGGMAASRWRELALPLVCWIFLAAHIDRLRAFAAESAPFEEVLAAAAPANRALTVMFDTNSQSAGNVIVYAHWPSWYQAERGGLVDVNFARSYPQIVRYRPGAVSPRFSTEIWARGAAGGFDWERDGASVYRYFFVRGALPATFFPAGQCRPELVKSAGDWSLYENVRCWTPSP